jgi:hypothetical protein
LKTHIEREFLFTDIHAPYQDKKIIQLFAAVVSDFKPHGITDLGDTCNYASYSAHGGRHDEEPHPKVSEDHTEANISYDLIYGAAPKAVKRRIKGNHDDWQRQWIMENNKQSGGIILQNDALQLRKRGFKEENIREYGEWLKLGKLYLTHGWRAGVNAVRQHLTTDYHCNFAMGHIHKSDTATSSNMEGKTMQGYAVGCGCKLDFKYAKSKNVNHGFALCYILPDGNFTFTNYVINNYRVIVEGTLYDFSDKTIKRAA